MAFSKITESKEARWISQEKYGGRRPFFFWLNLFRLWWGYPLAYIIGNTPFLSVTIDLSHKPFIPREETAYWVSLAIARIQKEHPLTEHLSLLDIYSGSGAIGIAIAKIFPKGTVACIEKSPRFIKQIEKNITLNHTEENTRAICYAEMQGGPYDYIFANPPYLSRKKHSEIQKSVLFWEPHRALFAPEDGLFYIRTLIEGAQRFLKPNGTLFIEHDPWQRDFITQKCISLGYSFEHIQDQYKNIRATAIYRHKNTS